MSSSRIWGATIPKLALLAAFWGTNRESVIDRLASEALKQAGLPDPNTSEAKS